MLVIFIVTFSIMVIVCFMLVFMVEKIRIAILLNIFSSTILVAMPCKSHLLSKNGEKLSEIIFFQKWGKIIRDNIFRRHSATFRLLSVLDRHLRLLLQPQLWGKPAPRRPWLQVLYPLIAILRERKILFYERTQLSHFHSVQQYIVSPPHHNNNFLLKMTT